MTISELEGILREQGLYKNWNSNRKYWEKRFELLEDAMNNKGIEYFHDLERIYSKAISETEKDIAKWYQRYARTEGITLAESKKQLTKSELKEFRMNVEEYVKKGESLDPQWVDELERASTKFHVTRLEALKLQMQQNVEYLMGNEADGIDKLMRDIFTDSYYHSAFEIQKGIGVGWDLMKLDKNVIDKAMSKPWTADGTNFSERIWGKYRPELIKKLHDGLTLNLIQGKSPDKLIDEITKQFNVKRHQAENLVQTEKAYFQSLAQKDAFNDLGVKEYEIVATLDSKTSDICREMDGKHFKLDDFAPGATAPPFHNRCRTATAPYFDDEFTVDEERAARDDSDGSYYTVPGNMKYHEWYKAFIDGDESILNKFSKVANVVDVEIIKQRLTEAEKEFSDLTEGYSYDDFMKDFGSIEDWFDGATDEEIRKAKELSERIEELRKMLYNDSAKETTFDIIGNTTKLKGAMSDNDYKAYTDMLNSHEDENIKKIYAKYADGINEITVTKNGGAYNPSSNTLKFSYEQGLEYEEIHKYSTLAHEYGHYFDAKAKFNVHFKEIDNLNKVLESKGSWAKEWFKKSVSSSDEFLEAVREDKKYLKSIFNNDVKQLLSKHHGSAGVQDAIDGLFVKSRINWGHGESYYNRKFELAKKLKIHNDIQKVYKELGLDASKQAKVKSIMRQYEAASEMWANIMSAYICGGKELEFVKEYLPNSYKAVIEILKGVE